MSFETIEPGHIRSVAGVNGAAVASLVLGILSALFFWGGWLFVITAAVAVVTGVVGGRAARSGRGQLGLATAGLVLGIIAAALELILLASIGAP